MTWSATTIWAKIALVVTLIGALLHLAAVAAPGWGSVRVKGWTSFGLWHRCEEQWRCNRAVPDVYRFWKAAQGLLTMALAFAWIDVFIIVLLVLFGPLSRGRVYSTVFVAVSFCTAGILFCGLVVFGHNLQKWQWTLGYCFGLSSISLICYLANIFLGLLHLRFAIKEKSAKTVEEMQLQSTAVGGRKF